jgi:serine/threonine-protein phosphatase 2B catalytic subunit
MLVAVLNTCSKEELEEEDGYALPADAEETEELKNKIEAAGRMSRVFALLRFVPFLLTVIKRS